MRLLTSLGSALAVLSLFIAPGRAYFLDEHRSIPAAGSHVYDPSVALDDAGDRLVVGMPGEVPRTLGATRGRVRVMRRDGSHWTIEATLQGSALTGDSFSGAAVAIDASGTRIAVGGPGGQGHVRVLVRSGTSWSEEAVLRPLEDSTRFGVSVALSDDGALLAVGWGVQRVDLYRRSGSAWSLSDTLSPDMARVGFGSVVEVADDGSRVFVGAPGARIVFDFAFDGVSWNRTSITPASRRNQFGQSLAVSGTGLRLAVGSVQSVIFFAWDGAGWVEEEELTGSGNFGAAVALSADGLHLAVGEPSHVPVGRVYTFVRDGGAWADDGTVVGAALQDPIGASVAFARGSVDWLIVGGVRESAGGTGGAMLFGRVGDPCTDASTCPTGHCADGVCCARACDLGCETCAASDRERFPGACTRLSAVAAAAVVCHPSTGPCDPEITCRPGSRSCPPDTVAEAGTLCRAALGPCDLTEHCDGVSADCPADDYATTDQVCRAATGLCDEPERCTGTSVECPVDLLRPAGAECRAATGAGCDVAEHCDGESDRCPEDVPMCEVDAGVADAGIPDAGSLDAGSDAGADDGGRPDAAALDGGSDAHLDAGPAEMPAAGCGCRTVPGSSAPWLALGVFASLFAHRRRLRARPSERG